MSNSISQTLLQSLMFFIAHRIQGLQKEIKIAVAKVDWNKKEGGEMAYTRQMNEVRRTV